MTSSALTCLPADYTTVFFHPIPGAIALALVMLALVVRDGLRDVHTAASLDNGVTFTWSRSAKVFFVLTHVAMWGVAAIGAVGFLTAAFTWLYH